MRKLTAREIARIITYIEESMKLCEKFLDKIVKLEDCPKFSLEMVSRKKDGHTVYFDENIFEVGGSLIFVEGLLFFVERRLNHCMEMFELIKDMDVCDKELNDDLLNLKSRVYKVNEVVIDKLYLINIKNAYNSKEVDMLGIFNSAREEYI